MPGISRRGRVSASRHPGLCHACGHDGHTALGLGLAALLRRDATRLARNVRLLFQPAEEGVRGASALIQQVLGARRFLAVHLGLGAPESGSLVTGLSGFLATTKFDARFTGRAAHAGLAPEAGRDALQGAAKRCWPCTPCLTRRTRAGRRDRRNKKAGSTWACSRAARPATSCRIRPSWPAKRVALTVRRTTPCWPRPARLWGALRVSGNWAWRSRFKAARAARTAMRSWPNCWPGTALELPPGPDGQPLFAAGKICSEGRMRPAKTRPP